MERIKITKQNGAAYGIISKGLKDLYEGRKTKESDLQLGWKEVLLLEKNHESKEIISSFIVYFRKEKSEKQDKQQWVYNLHKDFFGKYVLIKVLQPTIRKRKRENFSLPLLHT